MSFDSSDLDTLDDLDEGSLSPFVDASDVDPDVNLYLDKLFTETKRSGAFIIHGVETRVRQDESILQDVWDKMYTTYRNIGASDGAMGRGVLFERTSMTYDAETTFLKVLRFKDIGFYTILKYTLSTREISVNEWQRLHKRIPPRVGETDTGGDERKTYRFDGVNGVKLSLVGTSKLVADRFHDSMAEHNMVKSPLRGHGGLSMFDFPGEDIVSAARKRLFFLLDAKHRLAFCIQQIFGEADFDLYAFSHGITCASPNDVAYEQESSIFPLGCIDESVVGALESAKTVLTLIAGGEESVENDQISTEPPLKKHRANASRSNGGICEPSADNAEIQMPDEGPSAVKVEIQIPDESEESAREHAENLLIALGEPVPPIETMNENLRKRYSNAFSVLRGKDAKEPIVFDLKQWLICLAMYLYMTLVEYGLSVTKRENVLQVISIVLAFIFFVVLTTNSGHKNLDFFLYVVGYPICIYAIGIPWHTGIISAVMTIQIIALEFNRSLHHLLGLIVLAFIVSIIFTGNQGIWFVDSWWLLLLRAAPTYCVLYSQRVNNADAAGTIAVSLWRDLPLLLLQICMIFGYVK